MSLCTLLRHVVSLSPPTKGEYLYAVDTCTRQNFIQNKCCSGRTKYGLSFDDYSNSKQMSCSYFAVYNTLALHPRLTSAHFKARTMSAFHVCAVAMPESQKWATRNVVRRKSDRQVGQGSVCASFMTNRCHASDFAHETFFLTRNVQHKKLTRRSTPDKGTETEDTAVSHHRPNMWRRTPLRKSQSRSATLSSSGEEQAAQRHVPSADRYKTFDEKQGPSTSSSCILRPSPLEKRVVLMWFSREIKNIHSPRVNNISKDIVIALLLFERMCFASEIFSSLHIYLRLN